MSAVFVLPELAGAGCDAGAAGVTVPTLPLHAVADMLRARGYPQCDPESVGQLAAVLVGLKLCIRVKPEDAADAKIDSFVKDNKVRAGVRGDARPPRRHRRE